MGIKTFLAGRFSLHEDSAQETEIIDSITRNVEFRGSNLWSLIFAIFIASIGLNVNSTAVIIGAMLVSPLMGPIMGIGLGLGTNNLDLVRNGLKNLFIAAAISVCVSALYFFITPLSDAQSELLARTMPSIWDVFIALFGGLAGVVGGTRKEKSNVIPGVAIATALMPPLCTAGYGLAAGNWNYFFGAFYLFFINSVFICISTFIVVRYLKLTKRTFSDSRQEKRVNRLIIILVIVTALPSVYFAYNIVGKSIFERNARTFLKTEFKFRNTHIINKYIKYETNKKEIELLLIGDDLAKDQIDSLRQKLLLYKLNGTVLTIRQGFNARQQLDLSQIKESILQDIIARQYEQPVPIAESGLDTKQKIDKELNALYPEIGSSLIFQTSVKNGVTNRIDSILIVVADVKKSFSKKEESKLKNWLMVRTHLDSVVLVIRKKST